jgi:hypothetical protein
LAVVLPPLAEANDQDGGNNYDQFYRIMNRLSRRERERERQKEPDKYCVHGGVLIYQSSTYWKVGENEVYEDVT